MNSHFKEIQNLPVFTIINDNESLAEICWQAEQKQVVALDTEFVRIRTLYPQLGLIQMYDGNQVSLIDPKGITDFSPFIALLKNTQVLKVLHACFEDLEVFQHHFQQLPTPLMDTQVMAYFLGFPQSTGFATLVEHYFSLKLDKNASRTDWLARPLSEKQLNYAAADVWYLLPLYQKMQPLLAQTPYLNAAQFDCQLIAEKHLIEKDPEDAYKNIGNAHLLSDVALMRLKFLAKWRYKEAVRRDLALNFVVKAENLWKVAKYNPKNTSDLLELGLNEKEVRFHGKKMLQLLEQANRKSPEHYPEPPYYLAMESGYKNTLKQLQSELKKLAPEDLAAEVIASKRSLEQLMKWVWTGKNTKKLPDLLLNWRKPFGEKLLKFCD